MPSVKDESKVWYLSQVLDVKLQVHSNDRVGVVEPASQYISLGGH